MKSRIQRALLIVPPTGKFIREDRCQTPIEELKTVTLRPPVDLLYIAAGLERVGVECRVHDYPAVNGSWGNVRADLAAFTPDLLVLSITTPSLAEDMTAATLAKQRVPGILVAAKGAHFEYGDIETLTRFPDLDLVFRGEYELAAADIAERGGIDEVAGITFRRGSELRRNPDRPLIGDLDSLPYPARHLIDNTLYRRPDLGVPQTNIVTSRGCPFECIFCLAGHVSGRQVRRRSPENTLGEVRECVERFAIRDFLFRSDLFTADRKWCTALCDALLASGLEIRWSCNSRVDTVDPEILRLMKRAGCWLIAFGVESGSEMMLERMKKKATRDDSIRAVRLCREAGIKSSVYFLIGLPWETMETYRESVDLAKELSPDFLEIFYTYPFRGTEYYDVAVKEGLLREGEYPAAAYSHPSIPSLSLSLEQLEPLRRRFLREFYLRPGYILRTFAGTRSPKVFFNYLRYGWIQLWDLVASGGGNRKARVTERNRGAGG